MAELVASLYREQNKVQNLLSSLGFALRSFNNLNQFLDLTPLMAARVADAEGGALILSKNNGQVALDQLHCQDNQINGELRRQLEAIIRQLNQEPALENKNHRSLLDSLDHKIRQTLGQGTQVYSTPVLVKNSERGRLYVFSRDPDYGGVYQFGITAYPPGELILVPNDRPIVPNVENAKFLGHRHGLSTKRRSADRFQTGESSSGTCCIRWDIVQGT